MQLWTFMTPNIVEETTMSIFSAIMDKVFNRASAAQPASQQLHPHLRSPRLLLLVPDAKWPLKAVG